jgi:hypothetical protein
VVVLPVAVDVVYHTQVTKVPMEVYGHQTMHRPLIHTRRPNCAQGDGVVPCVCIELLSKKRTTNVVADSTVGRL